MECSLKVAHFERNGGSVWSGICTNVAYNSLVGVARTFNTYVNPLSPLVELATGKSVESDFTEEKSRVVSGAEGVMAFIPGGKIAGTAAKTVEKAIFKTASKRSTQGGLNLFKWGAPQTTKATGWKAGDYMLHLPNKGTPKLNWQANYRALRREMGLGKPIFDSYRLPDGNLIPTGGFLNAERSVLQGRGWIFNSGSGAWMPPGF